MPRKFHPTLSIRAIYYGILFVLVMLLGAVATYVNNSLVQRYQSEQLRQTQQQLAYYHNQLFITLQSHIQIVRGLPGLFAVNPALTQEQYALAVSHLVGEGSEIRNIAAAPDMVIRYMYPKQGNEAAIGLEYQKVPEQFEAAERARKTRNLVLAGPVQLKQGGVGLITRIPVFLKNDKHEEYFWGLVSAIIDMDRFFEKTGLSANMPIQLAIRGKDSLGNQGEVFFGKEELFAAPRLTQVLHLPEGEWVLAAEPLGGWQIYPETIWQQRLQIYGIAVAIFVLLAVLLHFLLSASLSNQKFRRLIESSPVPYLLLNHDSHVSFINQAFTDAFGYTLVDMQAMTRWTDIIQQSNHEKQRILTHLSRISTDTESTPVEMDVVTRKGNKRIVLMDFSVVKDHFDNVMLLTLNDMTVRKQAEEQLRFASQVFNQAQEGIIITSTHGVITDVNPAFSAITGYSKHEVLGKTPRLLRSDKHDDTFFTQMWRSINEDGYWQGEIWNCRKGGELYAELLTISALRDEAGQCHHYVGLFSDITQTKQRQETLELMAHYDVLTKLPNRALFADRFSIAAALAHRHKTRLAVCFLDLDNFKPVNDHYGHDVGDQLLVEVTKRLKNNVREMDTLSRFGGDEFAILFTQIHSTEECEHLLTRLHQSMAEPYTVGNLSIKVSVSSGVTYYPDDDADLDTLLRHADQAMYQAKLKGRNAYQLFDPADDDQTKVRQSWVTAVRNGLEHDQFQLYYQPKINMRTGEVLGMEALLRWQHPEKGLLAPNEFLATIEDADIEIALGRWVLNHAFDELNYWHQVGQPLQVSVNIASSHLQSRWFIQDIEATLQRHPQLPSSYLQLEILETSELRDLDSVANVIQRCRDEFGVSVALDDFGTGYSSLTHLRHLVTKAIKIDRSFISDMLDDPQDFTIVDGIIGLAEAFDRDVIAEGVETTEHGLMLLTLGCEQAQGYGIAKPMLAEKVLDWLTSYQPNSRWQQCDISRLSIQQRMLKLFRLSSEHWYQQIRRLLIEPASYQVWPTLDPVRCQCGNWIRRVREQEVFAQDWLHEFAHYHDSCHTLAQQLKTAHDQALSEQQYSLEQQFEQAFSQLQEMVETAYRRP